MATTKSGLKITAITTEVATHTLEHPFIVRFTHWLNALSLLVMTASGLQIFMAFPSFGEKVPQVDFLKIPELVRLGGWLGGALQWHFSFSWLFTLTGIIYAIYIVVTGQWRHVILFPREIKGILPMAKHYFLFKEQPEQLEPYNPLQKLAYTTTIIFGIAVVVTGYTLYKPVQLGWIAQLSGGFGMVRILHFASMCGFLAFIPGHLIMVALHGWNNFYSMVIGWKKNPDYLS
jgi:thiosulfate reductase cytochrome b subunit